ncbi:MAG: aldehyde dehydrogenase family protein, partial [Gammaproteobacteria bacterium]|nr:aldehyde dehydrogenase family protein [Gammaproteobacteria bacterium]
QATAFLEPELIDTDAGKSYVTYQPQGTVLAVMPWNFPLWQVIRAAAPAMAAGNTMVLKHASNVPGCAMAIEKLFVDAGFPENVFRTLLIPASKVAGVIGDPRVRAVTLTGSEAAGRTVAEGAGRYLKKSVLELGGSDAFIVLEDADLDLAARTAVQARFMNAGQSCIAAKRFIVVESVAEEFVDRFRTGVEALVQGDPMDGASTLAPMARQDLREELHAQVSYSIGSGAVAVTGCTVPDGSGAFYAASILDHVRPGARAWDEELFGPVATVIRA